MSSKEEFVIPSMHCTKCRAIRWSIIKYLFIYLDVPYIFRTSWSTPLSISKRKSHLLVLHFGFNNFQNDIWSSKERFFSPTLKLRLETIFALIYNYIPKSFNKNVWNDSFEDFWYTNQTQIRYDQWPLVMLIQWIRNPSTSHNTNFKL